MALPENSQIDDITGKPVLTDVPAVLIGQSTNGATEFKKYAPTVLTGPLAAAVAAETADRIAGDAAVTALIPDEASAAAIGAATASAGFMAAAPFVESLNSPSETTLKDTLRSVIPTGFVDACSAPFFCNPDGSDNTSRLAAAINFAAGRKVKLTKPGTYLIEDSLPLSVWRYSLEGLRTEMGCGAAGADPNYSAVRINFRPSDTTKIFIKRSNTQAPLTAVIGPFEHNDLFFDFGDANGFVFGDETLGAVQDGVGERYVFGVKFESCALQATRPTGVSNGAGQLARSGKYLVRMCKAFESSFRDVSLVGCDTQIRTFGCDKPKFDKIRSQGANVPFDLVKSGTFGVQAVVNDLEVEGWTFSPIRSDGLQLEVTDSSFEQIGSAEGRTNLTGNFGYTATVTANSPSIVFSSSMAGILFPGLSIIEISDGLNTDTVMVSSVNGANVQIESAAFAFTWAAATASVTRIHGYGPIHGGGYSASYKGIHINSTSANTPAFVFRAGYGQMSISSASGSSATANEFTRSLAIGNRLSEQSYLSSQMCFSGCSPSVCAAPSNPFVDVSNWADANSDQKMFSQNYRPSGGDTFDALNVLQRRWVYTPKRYGTAVGNMHLSTFKKINGDLHTSQLNWAWLVGAATNYDFAIYDESLPSKSAQGIRLYIRAKTVSGNATLSIIATGAGGSTIGTLAIDAELRTYQFLVAVPSNWTSAPSSERGIVLDGSSEFYLAGVAVTENDPVNSADYISNGLCKSSFAATKAIADSASSVVAKVALAGVLTGGAILQGKIRTICRAAGAITGYASEYAESTYCVTSFGGSLAILGAPVKLLMRADSVNAGVAAASCTVTVAINSGWLEISITPVATGSSSSAVSSHSVGFEIEHFSSLFMPISGT